jgi:hypothetical protein
MQTIRFAVLLLFTAGCGIPAEPCPYEPQSWTELGIGVYVDGEADPYTRRADFASRIDTVARTVGDYAGMSPSMLAGWVIVFRSSVAFVCNGKIANGCAHPDGWIELITSRSHPCVEQSALAHELLHAYGYWDHSDPRWTDWVSVSDALNATEPTYTTENGEEAACWTWPGLWYPGGGEDFIEITTE